MDVGQKHVFLDRILTAALKSCTGHDHIFIREGGYVVNSFHSMNQKSLRAEFGKILLNHPLLRTVTRKAASSSKNVASDMKKPSDDKWIFSSCQKRKPIISYNFFHSKKIGIILLSVGFFSLWFVKFLILSHI